MDNGPKVVCSIGAGAGSVGDRVDPAVALTGSGKVDTVVLECLAERTLMPALKARADKRRRRRRDPRLRRRLSPLLPVAAANGCRIVSNLGAANPCAAGEAIVAAELGCRGLRLAAIHGDDVMQLRDRIAWDRPVVGTLMGAHAYLGSGALAEALDNGADVVVSGRVADSALFAAAAFVSARCPDLDSAQIIEDEIYALTLSGPAGGCSVRGERRPRIEVLDGFIAPELVRPEIEWSRT